MRSGIDHNGNKWECKIPADYGYVKGTMGRDGDQVDVYVGPNKSSDIVFVVNQIEPESGKFDEHKCLLGFSKYNDAINTYDRGFSDSSGPKRRGQVRILSVKQFKDWLAKGGGKKPIRAAFATGGSVSEESKTYHGPLHSSVAGRTDHLPIHVDSGSYVIPADVVAASGENNTTAGFKVMKRLFRGIPYSNNPNPYGQVGPYGQAIQNRADGGRTEGKVPCVVAGGEHILSPDEVREVGEGDLATGHAVLDKFVKRVRDEHIKTLKNLPGPKK